VAGCGSCGETVVSAYDVARDSNANFFYGDIVVLLRHPTKITANDDLSWVGHVVDLCDDRHIHVK
jgi:ubiquitin-conjugating enzyme E2 O